MILQTCRNFSCCKLNHVVEHDTESGFADTRLIEIALFTAHHKAICKNHIETPETQPEEKTHEPV
jgi:hypothetical protein